LKAVNGDQHWCHCYLIANTKSPDCGQPTYVSIKNEGLKIKDGAGEYDTATNVPDSWLRDEETNSGGATSLDLDSNRVEEDEWNGDVAI
jgi:hypothetical protein